MITSVTVINNVHTAAHCETIAASYEAERMERMTPCAVITPPMNAAQALATNLKYVAQRERNMQPVPAPSYVVIDTAVVIHPLAAPVLTSHTTPAMDIDLAHSVNLKYEMEHFKYETQRELAAVPAVDPRQPQTETETVYVNTIEANRPTTATRPVLVGGKQYYITWDADKTVTVQMSGKKAKHVTRLAGEWMPALTLVIAANGYEYLCLYKGMSEYQLLTNSKREVRRFDNPVSTTPVVPFNL